MKTRRTGLRNLSVSLFGLFAAGCGLFLEYTPPACPEISVLGDAASITQFRKGPGSDPIDVFASARIKDVLAVCEVNVDESTGNGFISVKMNVVMDIQRGPANRISRTLLKYFVGLTDRSGEIVKKEVFPVDVTFPGYRTRINLEDDPVNILVPVVNGETQQVFVGYQLSKKQLDYNRKLKAEGRR